MSKQQFYSTIAKSKDVRGICVDRSKPAEAISMVILGNSVPYGIQYLQSQLAFITLFICVVQ
jgi:hypothetical protein